ncbi:MAG TPA: hypothetical protein DDY49_00360, partial [Paenibacillaceae bacterium]|nr:hypothetical protein [Paenibacillaceae bacterium]
DLATIQEGLAAQALAAVQTLDTYPYPPTDLNEPIQVKVENVPIHQLTSDMGLEIQVQMNQGLFDSLAHVRINSLDVRIEGVSTNTGKCHVQMESLGNPMLDRGIGMQRETLSFQMISREWHVVYDIESGKTIIGTQPSKEWGKYFTKPTPFQIFRVSLPMTAENAGLVFARQVTTVTLSFMLEAAYSKPPIRTSLSHSSRLTGNELSERGALTEVNGVPPFLELLKGCSITDGWDVVSFFSVDKINDLWKQRWDSETSEAFEGKREFLQEIKVNHTLQLPGKISVEYELEADAGPPWLQFVADNSQSAILNIPLLSCQLTTTTRDKEGSQLGQEIEVISTTVEKPVLIKTKAALKKLAGKIDANTVYIDPAQDTFMLENIELDPQVDIGICNEIVEYFKKQKLEPWKLGTLRFNSDIDFLKPRTFQFQTYTPPESRKQDWPALLAIYTLTTTPNPPTYGMRHIWPDAAWPVSADFDAAVYFSADLLWENEIIPAVKEQISDAEIIKNSKTNLYYVQLKGSTEVCNQKVQIKQGWQVNNNYKIVTEHARVNFSFADIYLRFNLSALQLECNADWIEQFPYQKSTPLYDPWCADVKLSTGWDDVNFSCQFNSLTNPKIDHDSLEITFDAFAINPEVNTFYSKENIWTGSLSKVKQSVIDNAKKAIEEKVSGLNINLKTMPMFAVSNLLFPESKTIEPTGIYCPRDLVIVGDVVREWKPRV